MDNSEDFNLEDMTEDLDNSEESAEEIFGVDPEATYRYIPKRTRKLPVEKQPVFLLMVMSAKDAASLQNNSLRGDKNQSVRYLLGSRELLALQSGVKGWENFNMKSGKPVPFRENNGKPRPDTFDYLPASLRQELAEAITSGTELSEQAEKN